MAQTCELCNKRSQKGKKIKLVWGVKYRSIRHRKPNLRKTTLLFNGKPKSTTVCASCLKSVKNGKVLGVTYPEYIQEETQKQTQAETEKNSSKD